MHICSNRMREIKNSLIFSCIFFSSGLFIWAGNLHETALLGPVGLQSGAGIASHNYMGARFYVAESSIVTRVGGHMGSPSQAFTFFALFVELGGANSLPQGDPFLAEEVVATTNFSMGVPGWPSFDLMVPFKVNLDPGWYGLIFGGGYYGNPLFGAQGSGIMPTNNMDIPDASYFSWSGPYPERSNIWQETVFSNLRFVVEGRAIDSAHGITAFNILGPEVQVTATNLLWGYETYLEAKPVNSSEGWLYISNSSFLATNSWEQITIPESNLFSSGWIRAVQED